LNPHGLPHTPLKRARLPDSAIPALSGAPSSTLAGRSHRFDYTDRGEKVSIYTSGIEAPNSANQDIIGGHRCSRGENVRPGMRPRLAIGLPFTSRRSIVISIGRAELT
jgi:hypothetical protein